MPDEIKSYRDLLVWQKGISLVKSIYALTSAFPEEERFGLTSQLRRAVVSIPSNIAEGQVRSGEREFPRFLSHATGSLAEVDTQVVIAIELKYCSQRTAEPIQAAIVELRKMLAGLRRSLKASETDR